MLGGDLISGPDFGPGEPPPGRALVWLIDPAGGGAQHRLGVRLTNDHNVVVTHELDLILSDLIPPTAEWESIIVVLASNPGDIRTAVDGARVSGWIPVAMSPPADYAATGYALGVGISTP